MEDPKLLQKNRKPDINMVFGGFSVNRTPNCLSWSKSGKIAFGTNKIIVIYNPKEYLVEETLNNHKGRVNCVKWIDSENEIISGGSDGRILCWKKTNNGWQATEIGKPTPPSASSTGSVSTSITSLNISGGGWLVSTSADGFVKIWNRKHQKSEKDESSRYGDWNLFQSIAFWPKIVDAAALLQLKWAAAPEEEAGVLAVAGMDAIIHLFCRSNSKSQFEKVGSVTGHTDWVRDLKFQQDTLIISPLASEAPWVLLSSCGKDGRIRLWKFNENSTGNSVESHSSIVEYLYQKNTLCNFEIGKGNNGEVESRGWGVTLETVLVAHEDWVQSIQWIPSSSTSLNPFAFISFSTDKTMILWYPTTPSTPSTSSSQKGGSPPHMEWNEMNRVGEVGGGLPGYWGGAWNAEGTSLVAYSHTGALYLWNISPSSPSSSPSAPGPLEWKSEGIISGHFGGVNDMSWDPLGQYVITVSEDETCRIWGPWKGQGGVVTWMEISRPVVHGFTINCLALADMPEGEGGLRMVMGADEKVLRVYDSPLFFYKSLANITGTAPPTPSPSAPSKPWTASVPALGLSNKPIYLDSTLSTPLPPSSDDPMTSLSKDLGYTTTTNTTTNSNSNSNSSSSSNMEGWTKPPLETEKLQSSLWPEIHKLYGHPNELLAVACNRDGSLIASSCKGTQPEQSSIRLWSTSTWETVGTAIAHKLSVVQLKFSPIGNYLLSVSRDRQVCIHYAALDSGILVKQLLWKNSSHERIIWTGDWTHDAKYFATGSRDKSIKIWKMEGSGMDIQCNEVTSITFEDPITALAFSPAFIKGNYWMVAGTESGSLSAWIFDGKSISSAPMQFSSSSWHVEAVKKLAWCPKPSGDQFLIASCSEDQSVRIYSIIVE